MLSPTICALLQSTKKIDIVVNGFGIRAVCPTLDVACSFFLSGLNIDPGDADLLFRLEQPYNFLPTPIFGATQCSIANKIAGPTRSE